MVGHRDDLALGNDLAAVFADLVAGIARLGAGGLSGVLQLGFVLERRNRLADGDDLAAVFADLVAGVARLGTGGFSGVFQLGLMRERRQHLADRADLAAVRADLVAGIARFGAGGLFGVAHLEAVSLCRNHSGSADLLAALRVGKQHAALGALPVRLRAGLRAGRLDAINRRELMHVRVGIAREAELAGGVCRQRDGGLIRAQRRAHLGSLEGAVRQRFNCERADRIGEDVLRNRKLDPCAADRLHGGVRV